jgi:excinuclease ABC subunit C
LPDLVVVDGGKGQLSAAEAVIRETGLVTPLAALAKEREEVFFPGQAGSLTMPPGSPARQLLQRLRDEAHRFALGYHVRLRQRASVSSSLDAVPGVGPKRKKALIRKFGSVRGLREAAVDEIGKVEGISQRLALEIKKALS